MSVDTKKTILLVEDDVVIALTEKISLEKYGYTVITASTGEKAIDTIEKMPGIDLILMDINLGSGIDGTEAAEQILKNHDLPVVFLSSHTEPEIVEKTEKITSYGYVVKSSSITVLDASIKMAFKLFEANRKIFENERIQTTMISNISDVIGIIGVDGIMKYKSPSIEKWFGWKPEDLVGTNGWSTVHPEDLDRIQKSFFTLLEKENSLITVEYRYKCKDGSFTWIELTAINLINDPVIQGVLMNYHDISKRKQTEEVLNSSEVRYRGLLTNIDAGIVVHAPDTSIIMNNPRASDLLGLSEDQMRGKLSIDPKWMFLHEDKTPLPLEEYPVERIKTFKESIKNHICGVNRPKSNDIIWLLVNGFPVLDNNGEITEILISFIDITERKKLEEALLESGKRLRDVYKLANIGLWDWEAATDTVTWSDELYRIAGIDPILPAPTFAEHSTYYSPESLLSLKTAVARTMENGETYQLDLKLVRPDGTIRNVMAFGGVKYDNNGRTIGLYGSVQDITDQKQVEEALRESEKNLLRQTNLFSSLLENLPIGVFMVEAPSGKPLVANEAATDVLGRGILPHVVKDNLSEVYNSFKAGTHDLYPLEEMPIFLGMTGKTSHIDDMVVERPDGTQSPLEVFGSPVMDEQGQVWASIVSFLDITERKRAEQVLRDIIDKNPMSIQIIDKKGFVLKVNSAHTKLFGAVPPSNYSVFNDFQLEEQGFGKLIERAKNGEIVYFPDFYYNAHDLDSKFPDVPVWIRMVTFPLFDSYGKPERFVTMQENITERKVAEEKIKALLAEKELILKEVHHRIKNNMNTIKGFLHLQVSTLKNPSAMAALKDAESRVHSMMVLYDKLYKADSFNDVSVKDYFPALVDQIIGNFPNSTLVKIENHVDDFMIDAKRLSSLGIIVNELLTNIMKYAFTGRSAGLITVSASLKGNRVYFIIADNGNGMPKSIDFENSTGFGLMLVKMLTKQIGGSIRIERENGTQIILEFEN